MKEYKVEVGLTYCIVTNNRKDAEEQALENAGPGAYIIETSIVEKDDKHQQEFEF